MHSLLAFLGRHAVGAAWAMQARLQPVASVAWRSLLRLACGWAPSCSCDPRLPRRWLPEHPGGSKIIPRQSLNLDCRWGVGGWAAGMAADGGAGCTCPRSSLPPPLPAAPAALGAPPCCLTPLFSRFFELYHASRESFIYLRQVDAQAASARRAVVPPGAQQARHIFFRP